MRAIIILSSILAAFVINEAYCAGYYYVKRIIDKGDGKKQVYTEINKDGVKETRYEEMSGDDKVMNTDFNNEDINFPRGEMGVEKTLLFPDSNGDIEQKISDRSGIDLIKQFFGLDEILNGKGGFQQIFPVPQGDPNSEFISEGNDGQNIKMEEV